MNDSNPKETEKKVIKIFFWCMIVPAMVAMFLRLYFVLFRYVFGTVLILIFGPSIKWVVVIIAVALSLLFTICTICYVYTLLKIHILEE